jgi:hypothetical protein
MGEILANMTQVTDVAPGPLVFDRRTSACDGLQNLIDQWFCTTGQCNAIYRSDTAENATDSRYVQLFFLFFFLTLFSSPELKAQVSYSDRPLSVRLSVCKLLHFGLLLQNHWANFNQT